MKFLCEGVQKLQSEQKGTQTYINREPDLQTNRQIDKQTEITENITYPYTRVVINFLITELTFYSFGPNFQKRRKEFLTS